MKKVIDSALEDTSYIFDQSGLWMDTGKRVRKLSNFIVVPLEFIEKDGKRFVRLTGYTSSKKLSEVVLPTAQYRQMNWITDE